MKYENFQKTKELCDQITKLKYTLAQLDNDIHIVIQRPSGGNLYTIGIGKNSEHEYAKEANNLVSFIRSDLNDRINKLKSELEPL